MGLALPAKQPQQPTIAPAL